MSRVDEDERPTVGERGPRKRPNPFDQRLADGERVADRYRIVRLLGAGAVGEVYEAEDEVLGEAVALKTLRMGVDDKVSVERFKREIQLARHVTHRNVCRTFDVGRHALPDETSLAFITMELLRGQSLVDVMAAHGRYGVDEALPLVQQMASGLDAAHAVGVVHRDFKPGNLMLVAEEAAVARVVITDFGLARRYALDDTTITVTGEAVGTPQYMAPEQVVTGQSPITPATDVYALGNVLYELVTGELPFKGSSITVMALKRFREAVPPPRHLVPDLDARWDAAILRCLELDPARRFQRAGDVAAALTADSVPPPPVAAPEGAAGADGRRKLGFFRRKTHR